MSSSRFSFWAILSSSAGREWSLLRKGPLQMCIRDRIATSILMDSTELLDTLEQEGIAIVGDDIVGDSKRFETDAPAHVDPFVSLARIWPHIEGCSVLYDPKKLRGPMLIDLYNQRKADGKMCIRDRGTRARITLKVSI